MQLTHQPVVGLVEGGDLPLLEQDHHLLVTKSSTSVGQTRHLPIQKHVGRLFKKNVDRTCGEPPPLSSVLQRSLLAGRLDREIVAERSSAKSSLRWNRTPEENMIVYL